MPDLFKPGDRDYVPKLNQLWQQLQVAGNPANPIFRTVLATGDAGRTIVAMGAKSTLVGGAQDDTPMIYSDRPLYMNQGLALGVMPLSSVYGAQFLMSAASDSLMGLWSQPISATDHRFTMTNNLYNNGAGVFRYKTTGQPATIYDQSGGGHAWYCVSSDQAVAGAQMVIPPRMLLSDKFLSTYVPISGEAPAGQEAVRVVGEGGFISFYNAAKTIRTGFMQAVVGQGLYISAESAQSSIFLTASGRGLRLDQNGNFYPVDDNIRQLGAPAARWAAVFSATGAIQTSDARKKTAVKPMAEAMRAAAREMLDCIGTYQWLDAINDKGADRARWHVGFTVQQAIAILEKHQIDPFSLAFICHDEWPAEYENRQINVGEKVTKYRDVQRQKVIEHVRDQDVIEIRDSKPVLVSVPVRVQEPVFIEEIVTRPDGATVMLDTGKLMTVRMPVMETVSEPYEDDADPVYEQVLIREAGEGYSFRYDQLALFILAGLKPN